MTADTLPEEPSSHSTSTNLLKLVVEGDQEAWSRFVSIYGAFIYARCRRAGVLPQDAADLVQDVLRRVLNSIGTLRRDQPGQGLRPWLQTISRNVINDHFRKLKTEREAFGLNAFQGILDEFPSPWDENSNSWAATPDVVLVLWQAMEFIRIDYEEKTWQAFLRTVVEEQPTAEVALDLRLAKGTVRQARYKILKRLRDELQGLL
ncbi:MAG: RNA polymerase sigma factor [Planctomycetaceae bacterium]